MILFSESFIDRNYSLGGGCLRITCSCFKQIFLLLAARLQNFFFLFGPRILHTNNCSTLLCQHFVGEHCQFSTITLFETAGRPVKKRFEKKNSLYIYNHWTSCKDIIIKQTRQLCDLARQTKKYTENFSTSFDRLYKLQNISLTHRINCLICLLNLELIKLNNSTRNTQVEV